jgi:2',3'-cyclic-nucleotide 2'-phosphodiesterase/3'-nucleotidase
VVERRGSAIALADTLPADSALAAFAAPYREATRLEMERVVGEATVDLESPRGRLGPGPVWALVQRAMLEASGADVALAPLFDPALRIPKGPVRLRDLMRLYPYDNTLVTVELTGAELEAALEQSARGFAAYTFEHDRALAEPGVPGWNVDMAEGVSYTVDLTRPPGERIDGLTFRGRPVAPDQRLRVAVSGYRANGGGGFEMIARAPRLAEDRRGIRDLIVDTVARARLLTGAWRPGWRVLPGHATRPERPLLDLLVRRGVRAADAMRRLAPDTLATRAEALAAIAEAWGWSARPSRAFAAAPDSVAGRLEALRARRVLPRGATWATLDPLARVAAAEVLDACLAAARRAGLDLRGDPDAAAYRRALLTGVSAADSARVLTRAQLLGIVANARFPTVRVLQTTDFHGAILGGARERRSQRPIGGSAVLAAHVERLRAENPEGTVLLDGGDCFQGTMVSNLQYGRPVVEQMNALRYAAAAIGNHEFDWSADTLWARAAEMRFAALGANMIERRSGRRPRAARADTTFVRRGVRVGVMGLCYRFTPTVTLPRHVAHLRFEDDSVWAARLAPQLRKRDRAAVVLSVGHTPAESDSTRRALSGDLPRMARGVRGVDAWFGGHSHNLVLDTIGGAPVLIPGALGQAVGVCDLVVDAASGRVVERRARLVTTYADEVVPDSAWTARVRRWNAEVGPVAATPVGRAARRIARGSPESAVGNLVTDAMRAATGAAIAFANTGGLRADLPEGVLTKGSVYDVMPFDNTLVVATLSGAEVRRVLEESLAYGRVTQVSGIRYVYDADAPDLQRVLTVTLDDGTPLDEARDYRVVCNNFMAGGGDHYTTLSRARDRRDDGELVRDAIERRVVALSADGGAVDVEPEGRITRRGGR